MGGLVFLLVLAALGGGGFFIGRARARRQALIGGVRRLHSLPRYHGAFVALSGALPALALAAVATLVTAVGTSDSTGPDSTGLFFLSRGVGGIVILLLAAAVMVWALSRLSPEFHARDAVERAITWIMAAAAILAILTTVGIVLSLLFESMRFFREVSPVGFLFGLHWSPQTPLRTDQIGASGLFGAVPLFAGTALITLIAMAVALPAGLFAAIQISEYARPAQRAIAKPILEILAGIPTVVYGFFAAITVAPLIRASGSAAGLTVAPDSALAAGLVMGIMILPFVSSLADDAMTAVPDDLRDSAYALGATQSEVIRQVVLPAALPGIVAAVLLAVSRALGETMIVVMAAGLAANLTANPLEAVTTVTVQIVTLLVGDQEFDSAKTLSAFALGITLFAITLLLNVAALVFARRFREKYE